MNPSPSFRLPNIFFWKRYDDILKNVIMVLTGSDSGAEMAIMKPTASIVRREGARTKRLERIVKGFANHRRIEILELLASQPDLCLGDISEKLQIEFKTASEHVRRLVLSGLVAKSYKGRRVRLRLADGTRNILAFLARLA